MAVQGSDGDRESRSPYLPSGYRVNESDREFVILRREDGSEVAVFGERAAWKDFKVRAQGSHTREEERVEEGGRIYRSGRAAGGDRRVAGRRRGRYPAG